MIVKVTMENSEARVEVVDEVDGKHVSVSVQPDDGGHGGDLLMEESWTNYVLFVDVPGELTPALQDGTHIVHITVDEDSQLGVHCWPMKKDARRTIEGHDAFLQRCREEVEMCDRFFEYFDDTEQVEVWAVEYDTNTAFGVTIEE